MWCRSHHLKLVNILVREFPVTYASLKLLTSLSCLSLDDSFGNLMFAVHVDLTRLGHGIPTPLETL